MAERKYTHGLSVRKEHGVAVVDIGDMEIWDGADLSLLRDTLTLLIQRERCKSVGVDMRTVKFVPSGFFGMLFDWFEQGVAIHIFSPQERVQRMLWFRRFFVVQQAECYRLRDAAAVSEEDVNGWDDQDDWSEDSSGDADREVAKAI